MVLLATVSTIMETFILLTIPFGVYIILMYIKKRRIARIMRGIRYKIRKSHEIESTAFLNEHLALVNDLYGYLNDRYKQDKIVDPLFKRVS